MMIIIITIIMATTGDWVACKPHGWPSSPSRLVFCTSLEAVLEPSSIRTLEPAGAESLLYLDP